MRKTLRTHLILVTEGRFFCFFIAIGSVFLTYEMTKHAILDGSEFYLYCIFAWGMDVVVCLLLRYFWPLCFGKLIFTERYVEWRCMFICSVKIPYTELKYVSIRAFDDGNVVPDLYATGAEYVLLSTQPLPKARIDRIRCRKGLIKFQFLSKDAAVFCAYLPEPFNRMFRSRTEAYTREKNRQLRKKQKRKAKRQAKRK